MPRWKAHKGNDMSLLAIGGSLLGGLFSSRGASKAADAQERAARQQIDLQRGIYDDTTQRFQPFYGQGLDAFNALRYEVMGGNRPTIGSGLTIEEIQTQGPSTTETYMDGGPREGVEATRTVPGAMQTQYGVGGQVFDTRDAAQQYLDAQGTPYRGFEASPGYQFRLQQGQDAISGSAAAQGNYFSGNTMKALNDYGQNMASQEYNNYLRNLGSLASSGQAAAGNQANAAANFGGMATQALGNIGNAQAAGAIGQANAINQGIGNALGAWQYGQMMQQQPATQPASRAPMNSLRPNSMGYTSLFG